MATRLRVAVVGQFSPPELIKINLDGDATSVRAALVLRAWEAQARVHARVYARVVRREIFARLRRAYRNRGPAGHPPDFLYTVRNSVQNHL